LENLGAVVLVVTMRLLVSSSVAFFIGAGVVVSKELASGMWKKYSWQKQKRTCSGFNRHQLKCYSETG